MKRFIQKFFQFFDMTRAEQRGTIVLLFILLIIILIRMAIPLIPKNEESYIEEIERKIAELERQKDSIKLLEANQTHTNNYSEKYRKNNSLEAEVSVKLFPFDPNSVSYDELLSLGVKSKTAAIFIKYRKSGATFYQPSDILKVYGIDSSTYVRLKPYITITREKEKKEEKKPKALQIEKEEAPKIQKIEINSADSATWTTLPGIGPVYARRICKFRNYLGGFVSTEQLKDVYHFPIETYENVAPYLELDTSLVQKINLNFAEVKELGKHPYCDYNSAKAIVNYRSKNGKYEKVAELMESEVIADSVYYKLKPYLNVN